MTQHYVNSQTKKKSSEDFGFGLKNFESFPWKLVKPYYHVCMFQVYHAKGGKVADGEKAKIKLTFSENTVKVKDFQLWNFNTQ